MAAMAFSAILQNSRYPASLYTDTLIRIRAEQGCVTWGRVSIVKAFLIKNYKNTEGEICMGLNEESNDVALCIGKIIFCVGVDSDRGKSWNKINNSRSVF